MVLTEGIVDADGPGHTLLTLDGGEHFGRILESNGAFAERVTNREEIDEAEQAPISLVYGLVDIGANSQNDWSNSLAAAAVCFQQ